MNHKSFFSKRKFFKKSNTERNALLKINPVNFFAKTLNFISYCLLVAGWTKAKFDPFCVNNDSMSQKIYNVCFFENAIKAKRFFQPIVDNLNKLQLRGLLINDVNHEFSFSTVVEDNLAAHMVSSFQSCFNSGNFCRRCYITYEDRKSPLPLSHIKVQTVGDHDNFVQEIKNNSNKSSFMGVIVKVHCMISLVSVSYFRHLVISCTTL